MLDRIKNSLRPLILNPFTKNGDNALATLGHVNALVDQINERLFQTYTHIGLTQSGTSAPTLRTKFYGDGCDRSCTSDCVVCDCPKTCQKDGKSSVSITARYVEVGKYELTVTCETAPADLGIFIGALQDKTYRITAVVTATANPKVFTVAIETNVNTTLTNGILNNTKMIIYRY